MDNIIREIVTLVCLLSLNNSLFADNQVVMNIFESPCLEYFANCPSFVRVIRR